MKQKTKLWNIWSKTMGRGDQVMANIMIKLQTQLDKITKKIIIVDEIEEALLDAKVEIMFLRNTIKRKSEDIERYKEALMEEIEETS